MNNIQTTIDMLNSHDLYEEADKIYEIAQICNCAECREYRNAVRELPDEAGE